MLDKHFNCTFYGKGKISLQQKNLTFHVSITLLFKTTLEKKIKSLYNEKFVTVV